ncbi:ABC transporter permease [Clostridium pasteurianum]|uniref:ABC transporter permease n=1 Tax=Clostridium pasteurianum TaxID=1501 RepID=UPI002260F6C8|nr:ABC transporter permease [Clostridium pasteurianum]UZW16212.1 ABC transporter permease [Clostridium pasteurianum]
MNIRKIIKLRFIISLIVLIMLIILSTYFNLTLNKNVSDILEYKKISESLNTKDNGITFNDLYKTKEKYKELTFTGYKEILCDVKNKYGNSPGKKAKTKMVLTDENYFNLYSYKMIAGGKIDFLSVKNGNKIVVISDVLANDLFKSTKVIGNIISLNDENYKIVGVYRENQSFAYSISEDGYERVYVPYTSYSTKNKNESLFLDIFSTRETSKNSYKNINNNLSRTLGGSLSLYNIVNYTTLKKISFQYTRIFYFIIGICGIILLIKIALKYFKSLAAFFKEKLKTNYFGEILRNNKKKILFASSKILLCLVGVMIIFNLIQFNITIDNKYLPNDNIFDISFYRKTIIDNMQLKNANESGFSNVYDRYITNVINLEKMTLLGEIIIFIVIMVDGKLLLMLKSKKEK